MEGSRIKNIQDVVDKSPAPPKSPLDKTAPKSPPKTPVDKFKKSEDQHIQTFKKQVSFKGSNTDDKNKKEGPPRKTSAEAAKKDKKKGFRHKYLVRQ